MILPPAVTLTRPASVASCDRTTSPDALTEILPTTFALEPSAMTKRPALAVSASEPAVAFSSSVRSPLASVRLKVLVPAATPRSVAPALKVEPTFSQLLALLATDSKRGARMSKALVALPMPAALICTAPAASTFQLVVGSSVLPSSKAPPVVRLVAPLAASRALRISASVAL